MKLIDLRATIQSFLNSNLFGSLIVKSALEFDGKFQVRLEDGIYNSIEDLVQQMRKKFVQHLDFTKRSNGIIISRKYKIKSVEFSKNLAKILNIPSSYTINHFEKNIVLFSNIDLTVLVPQHFIICCDMVEHSILGGQQVQVLKLVSKKPDKKNYCEYEFYNNDYVKLGLKEFEKIRIKIMTVAGDLLKCDPTLQTRLQLLFVNTNSKYT